MAGIERRSTAVFLFRIEICRCIVGNDMLDHRCGASAVEDAGMGKNQAAARIFDPAPGIAPGILCLPDPGRVRIDLILLMYIRSCLAAGKIPAAYKCIARRVCACQDCLRIDSVFCKRNDTEIFIVIPSGSFLLFVIFILFIISFLFVVSILFVTLLICLFSVC